MFAFLREFLIITDPGPYRARLLALATYRRKGRLPKGEKRLVRFYMNKPGFVAIPRGLLPKAAAIAPLAVEDRRLLLPPVDFAWRGQLRPEQAEAARKVAQAGGGMLVAMTGAGKTEMALSLVAAFRQPCLWLAHTKDLVKQALARAKRVFNLPPKAYGYIGEGEFGIGTHFTAATLQSLTKGRHRGIEGRFGTIVMDEADLAPAITYAGVISRFPAKFRIGVTATPDREDGLGPLAMAILGPAMFEVSEEKLVANKRICIPAVYLVPTSFTYWGSGDWSDIQRSRAVDMNRNRLVCSLAAREFRAGHRVIVLAELKRHAMLLSAMLRRIFSVPSVCVMGPVPTAARNKAFRAAEEGRAVLVATKLADRGLDLPVLDRLFLAAPGRSLPRLQHQVGRVVRTMEGKQDAAVYDFVDHRVETLRRQAMVRVAWYREKGYEIKR